VSCRSSARRFSSSVPRASSLLSTLRNAPIDVHPEVEEAIHAKKPVVALETAIVTHGMPFPTNLETARSLEQIVRGTGSVPATIGVIGGRIKIGLKSSEIQRLGDTERTTSVKISRRDIGPALATKSDGGTTCSATLIFAALAGIKARSSILRILFGG
jgi:pseudouridine-5'-phosphate glycosidase/pseudouridine kinase